MKILIAEDEPLIAANLYETLLDLGYDPLRPVEDFYGAATLLRNQAPEFALLDINLRRNTNGFQIAQLIRAEHKIPFIFLTTASDRATIALAAVYKPAGYLVKPFTKENLFAAIELALAAVDQRERIPEQSDKQKTIHVKLGTRYSRVDIREIVMLQSDGKYTILSTNDNKNYPVRLALKKLLDEEYMSDFVRIHKSCAINKTYIKSYTNSSVIMPSGSYPVGRNFKNNLKLFSADL